MFKYNQSEVLKGIIIYSAGDLTASIILGQASLLRVLAVMMIGGGLYAWEIPNYFAWIERKTTDTSLTRQSFMKTLYAFAYFNPIWIARHLFLIYILTGKFSQISWNLIWIGWQSFFWKIPFSFAGNYIVQVKLPFKYRFAGSAVLSSLFALYYAVSERIFH